jgi:isopentenyldiphosphate isomerase/intracellular septation protein A
MNNVRQIIRQFLPGLIPLFIFIIADELWGTEIGLIVAVSFGVGQLVFTLIREKRLDKFLLLDTGLIVALGLVSILLDNDIFFKLKPGLIGALLCIILAFSAFSPYNIIFTMSKRYMGDVKLNDDAVKRMRQSLILMLIIFSLHTALVFYSAFYLSKEAWAFISGGLFYILFGFYALIEFIRIKVLKKKMLSEPGAEWVPLVDTEGKVTGRATRQEVHSNPDLLHPVVHLHVFGQQGKLLLQLRPLTKDIQPGKWDTAVGGHLMLNENVEKGLMRECMEELGIKPQRVDFIGKYVWKSDRESELVFVFGTLNDGPFNPDKTEVDDLRFWTPAELEKGIKTKQVTPNFAHEYKNVILPFLKKLK